MRQLLIQRWQSFDQREQRLLVGCGLIMLLLLFYAYLWLPTQLASEKFAKEIPKKAAQLNVMKIQAAEIQSKRDQFNISKSASAGLNDLIERSANSHGITLEKMSDQADAAGKSLHVQIASTGFDAWIKWTAELHANQGILVNYCLITPNLIAGTVKIDAILEAQK
jgi:general secretion pathway protein M